MIAMRQKKGKQTTEQAEVKAPEVEKAKVEEPKSDETEQEAMPKQSKENAPSPETDKEEEACDIPDAVDKILRLYPQYKECFVSKEGFVYPKNAPKYQRGNAVLYKNKYFNS